MKLADLEAKFIVDFKIIDGKSQWRESDSVDGAQGVCFICPKCQGHSILVPFANPQNATVIPQEAFEKIRFRWTFSGESIETLSLQPSVDLSKDAVPGTCLWHGFVANGNAQ